MEDLAYIKSISPDEMTDQEFYEWLDSTEARHNRYLEIVFNDSDESYPKSGVQTKRGPVKLSWWQSEKLERLHRKAYKKTKSA